MHRIFRTHPEKQSRYSLQRGYNLRLKLFGITDSEEDAPDMMITKDEHFPTSSDPRLRAEEEAENNRGLSPVFRNQQ
jgi:hypothetical protein